MKIFLSHVNAHQHGSTKEQGLKTQVTDDLYCAYYQASFLGYPIICKVGL